MGDVTRILADLEQGDPRAAGQLLPLVYDELRRLAAQKMAHESPDQTLQPTALVHEAYLRLVNGDEAQIWNGRGHFFGAAAPPAQLLALDEALEKLAADDDPAAKLVKLRFFAGFSIEQAADVLGISRASAYRLWSYARASLHCELRDRDG